MLIKFIVTKDARFHIETVDIDMKRNRIWKLDTASKDSYLRSLNEFILRDIYNKRIIPE